MDHKEFYSELGKLLYAVADADGVISIAEKKKLMDIVREELLPSEDHKDDSGTNDAFYAEFEFDYMDEQIIEPEVAFESFVNFAEDHYTALSTGMKNTVIRLAQEIAKAYHGVNRKEAKILDELAKKFRALEKGKAYTPKLTIKEPPDI